MIEGGKWMEMKKGKLKDWTSGRLPFTQHFLISITTPFTPSFFFLFFLIKHTPQPHRTHTQKKKTVRAHTDTHEITRSALWDTHTHTQRSSSTATLWLTTCPLHRPRQSESRWDRARQSHTHTLTNEGRNREKKNTYTYKKKGAGGVRGATKQTPQDEDRDCAWRRPHLSYNILLLCHLQLSRIDYTGGGKWIYFQFFWISQRPSRWDDQDKSEWNRMKGFALFPINVRCHFCVIYLSSHSFYTSCSTDTSPWLCCLGSFSLPRTEITNPSSSIQTWSSSSSSKPKK